MQKFEQLGLRASWRSLREVHEAMTVLVAEHESKFGAPLGVDGVRASYLRFMAGGIGAWSRVLCVHDGARMIAGLLAFDHGDTLYVREVGTALDAPRAAFVSFNLMFYQLVRSPPGLRRVHYGIGTLEGKVMRGSTLNPLWYALDPLAPLADDLSDELARASERRLAVEAAMLGRHRDAATVRAQLALDHAALLHAPLAGGCEG